MIFTGEHYYLGLIQAALAVFYVLFGVFVAGRSRVFDRVGAWLIGAYLLMYKFNEYGPFRTVPLDLSAVSYFLFGVAAFVPFRPLKAAGSFSAMLSGSVYFFTMILYPETHVENLLDNRWFLLTMAMVNHNVMFFGGMLVCAEYRFERTDYAWVLGWMAFYLTYFQLITVGYGITEGVTTIAEIVDGSLVAEVLGVPLTSAYYAIYYIIVALALALIFVLFKCINSAFMRRKDRNKPRFLSCADMRPAWEGMFWC